MSVLPKSVSLNGRLVPAARAKISVFDRGFLYGDGLFETLRSYRGALVALDDHLLRLKSSAAFFGIPVPDRPWAEEIRELLLDNDLLSQDASVRITVTRGPGVPGLLPPTRVEPTVLMVAAPVAPEVVQQQRAGINVTLLPFAKSGFLAEHKLLNYVPAILGRLIAQAQQAQEALYAEGGWISEGTTSNLFLWRGGKLLTTPLHGLLPGVTRRWVSEIAAAKSLPLLERPISVRALKSADEAFLTASVVEVLPVVRVEGQPIGTGRVGPITRKIQRFYRQLVDRRAATSPR